MPLWPGKENHGFGGGTIMKWISRGTRRSINLFDEEARRGFA